MTNQLFRDAVGWGFALWLIGYGLGILLFFIVPTALIGWVIMPIASVLTLWVALRRLRTTGTAPTLVIAIVWTTMAIAGDYVFIVKALAPSDGYYKPDVYLYYALTFAIPLIRIWSAPKPVQA